MKTEPQIYTAGVSGRDLVTLKVESTSAGPKVVALLGVGCLAFLRRLSELRNQLLSARSTWPEVEGADHASQLLREVVLKAQGKWNLPYADQELCHCRSVATRTVEDAIVCGAQTTDQVARLTSAGSACGTCRPDTQKMIEYRRGAKAS